MLTRQTFTQYDPSLKFIAIKVDVFSDPKYEHIAEDLMVEIMSHLEKFRMVGTFGDFREEV